MSLRASSESTSPRACSGDMNCGVPMMVPAIVLSAEDGAAPPGSVSFTALRVGPPSATGLPPAGFEKIFASPQSMTSTSP